MTQATQTSSYTGGMLFSAAAYAAGDVADISLVEMEQKILDQQAKQEAMETQAAAAVANCNIAVNIGEEQKQQSFAQAYGEFAAGGVMAGAEIGSIGYSQYRSNLTEVTSPTDGYNAKIQNNQQWRDVLAEPKEGSMEFRSVPGENLNNTPTLEDANRRLKTINHNQVDMDPTTYEGGLNQLKADAEVARTAGTSEVGSPLRDARETTKDRLDENQKAKQSFDSQTDDIKGKLTRLSQLTGQLATGAGNMERGKHQALQGEQEGLKSLQDLVNSSAQSIAQGMSKVSDQRDDNIANANRMFETLINSNV